MENVQNLLFSVFSGVSFHYFPSNQSKATTQGPFENKIEKWLKKKNLIIVSNWKRIWWFGETLSKFFLPAGKEFYSMENLKGNRTSHQITHLFFLTCHKNHLFFKHFPTLLSKMILSFSPSFCFPCKKVSYVKQFQGMQLSSM